MQAIDIAISDLAAAHQKDDVLALAVVFAQGDTEFSVVCKDNCGDEVSALLEDLYRAVCKHKGRKPIVG